MTVAIKDDMASGQLCNGGKESSPFVVHSFQATAEFQVETIVHGSGPCTAYLWRCKVQSGHIWDKCRQMLHDFIIFTAQSDIAHGITSEI